jgi:hypothetical protein
MKASPNHQRLVIQMVSMGIRPLGKMVYWIDHPNLDQFSPFIKLVALGGHPIIHLQFSLWNAQTTSPSSSQWVEKT